MVKDGKFTAAILICCLMVFILFLVMFAYNISDNLKDEILIEKEEKMIQKKENDLVRYKEHFKTNSQYFEFVND